MTIKVSSMEYRCACAGILCMSHPERHRALPAAQGASAGSGRTVSDVDADLEALDAERAALEHRKEAAQRKQERLR